MKQFLKDKFKVEQKIPIVFTDVYDINDEENDKTSKNIKYLRELKSEPLDVSDITI